MIFSCKPEMETGRVDWHRSGRPAGRVAGRVEILRPAGQAGWKTSRIFLSGNQKSSKHQPKYTYIFYHK